MVFGGKSDVDRLKDAELCILLKLPVMSTVDNRKMLLGLLPWKLNLQLFSSCEMTTLAHVGEACRNVNMVMEVCFGKEVGLMVNIVRVVKVRAVVQNLAVGYVTRSIDGLMSVNT